MRRARLNIFLEPEHMRRLDELAAHRGLSKSSIVAAALSSFLSPDAADRREAVLTRRLDRLSRQFDTLEQEQTVLIETVALFIRYFLMVTPPLAAPQQASAQAQGRVRFQQFIEQLGRHLMRGQSLVKDVRAEVCPSSEQYFAEPDEAEPDGGDL